MMEYVILWHTNTPGGDHATPTIGRHLVGDGHSVADLLEHPALQQGLVPLAHSVSFAHGLDDEGRWGLNPGLAPVHFPPRLPPHTDLLALHQVPRLVVLLLLLPAVLAVGDLHGLLPGLCGLSGVLLIRGSHVSGVSCSVL